MTRWIHSGGPMERRVAALTAAGLGRGRTDGGLGAGPALAEWLEVVGT